MRLPLAVAALSVSLLPTYVVAQELPVDESLTCELQELVLDTSPQDPGFPTVWGTNRLEGPLLMAALRQQQQQQQQPQTRERGWIRRHPILTGALLGAGAGAVVGASTCSAGMLGSGYGCQAGGDRAAAALVVGGLGAAAGALWGAVIEWIVD